MSDTNLMVYEEVFKRYISRANSGDKLQVGDCGFQTKGIAVAMSEAIREINELRGMVETLAKANNCVVFVDRGRIQL